MLHRIEAGEQVTPTDKGYKAYLEKPGSWYKVYFQHFTPEQQARFIALWNEGKMKMGTPGYFYVLPFFIRGTQ